MKHQTHQTIVQIQKYLPLCLGVLILAYLVARVFIVPVTVDEYLSLTYFVDSTWSDVLTSRHVDITHASNNHVLNSIFMKIAIAIFGEHDWSIRLHILASFAVCYFFIWKILSLHKVSALRITAYLMIIFLNPYLLDFFGIARGYALSMAGWAGITYYFIQYSNKQKARDLTNCMIWLFVAVYSNFSAIYFAIIFGGGIIYVLAKNRKEFYFGKHVTILISGALIITAICGLPLFRTIIAHSAHGGTVSFFHDSVLSYVSSSVHYNPHIGVRRKIIFGLRWAEIYSMILVAAWAMAFVLSFRLERSRLLAISQNILVVQCVSVALLCTGFFKIMGAPYPLTRTTLLFSLPFIVFFLLSLEQVFQIRRKSSIILSPIIVAVVWHFMVCFNFDNTFEWHNEGDAKKVLNYMATTYNKQPLPTLGVENWRYPSMAFYKRTIYKDKVAVDWSALEKPINFGFIYVPASMEKDLMPEFVREREFKHGILMKKIEQH